MVTEPEVRIGVSRKAVSVIASVDGGANTKQ